MKVGYYTSASGRSPPQEELADLSEPFRGAIRADIHTTAEHGTKAPVQMKPIKGHSPMWEIRTGGYRTFYYFERDILVVLHVCKKQDQDRGIKVAYRRMNELMDR